jgi:acetyltransferase-like isoleucine patch superfamily enzyme
MQLFARWWGVSLGDNCSFHGHAFFRRHPRSTIRIGANCIFNSLSDSNLIGVNRPCIISTLAEGARITIGSGCGFSGTIISSAIRIAIEDNVRCGANTIITDTDWHTDDPRSGTNAPITIEKNVWLGANVTVLKGVTIGKNTMVGTGSLVIRSLPPNVIATGSPAKTIRLLTEKMDMDPSDFVGVKEDNFEV